MSYNPIIPQPTDRISQSQSQILENFTQLNNQFGLEHTAFDSGSDQGKHKAVRLLNQGGDPVTGGAEGGLYTKMPVATSELYYRYQSNGNVQQATNRNSIFGACFAMVRVTGNSSGYTIAGTPINVTSVTNPLAVQVQINFTNNAPSLDYMVIFSAISQAALAAPYMVGIVRNVGNALITLNNVATFGSIEYQFAVILGLG